MKVLAFVDLHGSKKSLKELKKKAKKADLVVCAGDFTIFGNEEKEMLSEIDKFNKPVLMIHGNHEEASDLRKSCSKTKNVVFIHKRKYQFGNYYFIGWGGGGFSRNDKGFENYQKRWKFEKDDNLVLVTHAPPYKTKIDQIYGEHAGCKSFRKFISKHNPILSISGHLHENEGKVDKIKKTRIINPGHEGKILEI